MPESMTPRQHIDAIAGLPQEESVRRLQVAETILSSLASSSARTVKKANDDTPWPAIGPYPEERESPTWWRSKWEQEAAEWLNAGG